MAEGQSDQAAPATAGQKAPSGLCFLHDL
jgi:hypothetical protein